MCRLIITIIALFTLIPPSTHADGEKIKVGLIFPMTGGLSESGAAARTGLQMALDSEPGNNLEIFLEDDAYDPKRTVAAFTKLTNVDHVDVVFGLGSGTTNSIAPLAQRQKIPVFSLALNVAGGKNNPYVMRTSIPGIEVGRLIGKIVKEGGYKHIGVVVGLSELMISLEDGLIKSVPPQTIAVKEEVAPDESDFRSAILKMRAQNVDAVVVLLLPGKIGLFAKQARELGLKGDFIGSMFFESKLEVDLSGGALIGSVYAMHDSSDDFRKRFAAIYGSEQYAGVAGMYYDLIKLLLRPGVNGKNLLERMKDVKSFAGVLGTYDYREDNGDNYYSFEWAVKRVVSSTKFERVKKQSE